MSYNPTFMELNQANGVDNNSPAFTIITNGTLRNNFTGYVGAKITVGTSAITVTSLGRVFITGNSQTHTIALYVASTGLPVSGGSVSLALSSGVNHSFIYKKLSTPVVLSASTSYYLVSQETNGGDQWEDVDSSCTINTDFTSFQAVYGDGTSGGWNLGTNAQVYVPVNLRFHL